MRLSPAEYVIQVIGGVRKTARALGMAPPSVSKWYRRKGQIPSSRQKQILDFAQENNLDIQPEDLILGRHLNKLKD